MDIEPKLQQQLFELFKVELEEQLETISDCLLCIEKSGSNTTARQEQVGIIFRLTHNIKGSSLTVGIDTISTIAHKLEDIFSGIRDKKAVPSSDIIDISFKAVDNIRAVMKSHIDNTEIPFELKSFLEEIATATKVFSETDNPPKPTLKKNPPPKQKESKTTEKPKTLLPDKSNEKSKTIEPDTNKANESSDYIKVTTTKISEVAALADELQTIRFDIDNHTRLLANLQSRFEGVRKLLYYTTQLEANNSAIISDDFLESIDNSKALTATIDKMNHEMHVINNHLEVVANRLQTDIRNLRLVPANSAIRPMMRNARDLARELDKKVNLEIYGDDVEIDRIILDLIKAPLVHLLRNAIDHGIEDSATREKHNKPAEGNIIIKLTRIGSQIELTMSDDGQGIDYETVASKALKLNLIKENELNHLSKEEKLDLIFMPGFSTCDEVSSISGRGVGLDVVRKNLEEAKGQIHIATDKGKGTTFTLMLPVTLVTDRGMFFTLSNNHYIIPTPAIYCVMKLPTSDIRALETGQAIVIDKQPVPLHNMGTVLNITKEPDYQKLNMISIIVLSNGKQRVAFIVDNFIQDREIVVKPLLPPLNKIRKVAGATMTGHGEVIIVLNPIELINSALGTHTQIHNISHAQTQETRKPTILVVDDSITTRTLEANILSSHGFDVTTAVNGEEAWQLIQHQTFDLVVTDIEMPIMTGFELTENIKQNDNYKNIPVIIVSSCSDEKDKERGLNAGADAYIVKSQFETKVLLNAVSEFI